MLRQFALKIGERSEKSARNSIVNASDEMNGLQNESTHSKNETIELHMLPFNRATESISLFHYFYASVDANA